MRTKTKRRNPKRTSKNRTETMRFRCTSAERRAIEQLAERKADGNVSRLILSCVLDGGGVS
jgi:hypothetical protein